MAAATDRDGPSSAFRECVLQGVGHTFASYQSQVDRTPAIEREFVRSLAHHFNIASKRLPEFAAENFEVFAKVDQLLVRRVSVKHRMDPGDMTEAFDGTRE